MEASKLAKIIAEQCIARRVRLVNRVITGIYDRALQSLGVRINQITILVMLTVSGPATSTDICKALQMEKSTVSRNVDRMRKKEWIEIRADGPSRLVAVNPKGSALLAAAHEEWTKAQKKAAELLGKGGVEAVRSLHATLENNKQIVF